MKTNFSLLIACIAYITLLGVSVFPTTSAYPNGSGTCKAGPAVLASASPHLESDRGGTLADGGYTTSFVNGIFTLKATGSGNYFKGFLLRLSSNSNAVSAAGAIELHSGKAQLMDSTGASIGSPATCAVRVAGACHNDNSHKTAVGVKLNLDAGVNYRMMVTVVKNEHDWYYGSVLV